MSDFPPEIRPEDYSQFVANLRAYFEATRATARDGGPAAEDGTEPLDPDMEQDLLRLFTSGAERGIDADVIASLLEALRALAPEEADASLPGWAEFIARLFRYEQDFLIELEEADLPEAQRKALRRQMVGFFRGLARQLAGHLEQGPPQGVGDNWLRPQGALPGAEPVAPIDQLLASISDPACLVDSAGRIRYVNPALRGALPGSSELLGTPAAHLFRWEGVSIPGDRFRTGHVVVEGAPPRPVAVTILADFQQHELWLLRWRERADPDAAGPAAATTPTEARPLLDENQRLRSIYRAWLSLGIATDEADLLPIFLKRLDEVVPWGAAAVLLPDPSASQLWTSLPPDALEGWTGLAGRLTEHFELFAHQPVATGTLRPHHLGLTGHLVGPPVLPPTEALVLPLVAGDRVWGVLALYRGDGGAYSSQEVQAVAILAHGLAAIWRQLLTTRALQRTNDHIQQELRFARRVQRNFLPQPTVHPQLRIVTRFVPASSLSGDFYLFDQPAEGPVTILIGDVAGHGIPAALMMMTMVGIFTELLPHGRTKFHELLPLANLACCQVLEENYFVTAQALRIDPLKHTITLCNAGHPPPLHLAAASDHCEFIDSSGLPLGMFSDAIYTVKHVPYHPGDRLLCYTDGLIEVRDHAGRPFSKERLRTSVNRQRETPSTFLLDGLVDAALQHSGRAQLSDDVALICVDLLDPTEES